MRLRGFYCTIAVLATAVAYMSACSVDHELHLRADGTGSGELRVKIDPVVVSYVQSLASAFGNPDGTAIDLFDVEAIRNGIDARAGLETVSIERIGVGSLDVAYRITNFEDAVGELATVARFQNTGVADESARRRNESLISFEINRATFLILSRLFLSEDSPAAVFVPVVETDFLLESEYRELVSYAFGDFLAERSVDSLLSDSRARVTVSTDGTIEDVVGGTIEANGASFDLAVLDLLTLEEPVTMSISWR